MRSVTYAISEKQIPTLNKLAHDTRISRSEHVRRALDLYFAKLHRTEKNINDAQLEAISVLAAREVRNQVRLQSALAEEDWSKAMARKEAEYIASVGESEQSEPVEGSEPEQEQPESNEVSN